MNEFLLFVAKFGLALLLCFITLVSCHFIIAAIFAYLPQSAWFTVTPTILLAIFVTLFIKE